MWRNYPSKSPIVDVRDKDEGEEDGELDTTPAPSSLKTNDGAKEVQQVHVENTSSSDRRYPKWVRELFGGCGGRITSSLQVIGEHAHGTL